MRAEYDNVFVCYTVQNYLKALYLAYLRHMQGERSKILALFLAGTEQPSFRATRPVYWADIQFLTHSNPYVRLLERDRAFPARYLGKLARKVWLKGQRHFFKREERQRLLREVDRAERVFLFLEKTYFSTFLLQHRTCTLVEEGVSVYRPYRWRSPCTLRPRSSFPGEHVNIERVLLQHPERANAAIRAKVARLELSYRDLPPEARRTLLTLFPVELPEGPGRRAILVPQAWGNSAVGDETVMALYRRFAQVLRGRGYRLWIKTHPGDAVRRWESLGGQVMKSKAPLDAFEFVESVPTFDCAVSVLKSSLATTPNLARRTVCFLEEDIPVEAVSAAMFEQATANAEARLSTALDGIELDSGENHAHESRRVSASTGKTSDAPPQGRAMPR